MYFWARKVTQEKVHFRPCLLHTGSRWDDGLYAGHIYAAQAIQLVQATHFFT